MEFSKKINVCENEEYPYLALASTCSDDRCNARPGILRYRQVRKKSRNALILALNRGPVVVVIKIPATPDFYVCCGVCIFFQLIFGNRHMNQEFGIVHK